MPEVTYEEALEAAFLMGMRLEDYRSLDQLIYLMEFYLFRSPGLGETIKNLAGQFREECYA